MKLPSLDLHSVSTLVGALACVIFGAADLWAFHSLAKETALVIFLAGPTALGVSVAYGAGLRSDPSSPAPPA